VDLVLDQAVQIVLSPVHSQLLGTSQLLSSPPPIDMLKFRGSPSVPEIKKLFITLTESWTHNKPEYNSSILRVHGRSTMKDDHSQPSMGQPITGYDLCNNAQAPMSGA
jgi:hypothetical protein